MILTAAVAIICGLLWTVIAWMAGWALLKTFLIATALSFCVLMALASANGDDFP